MTQLQSFCFEKNPIRCLGLLAQEKIPQITSGKDSCCYFLNNNAVGIARRKSKSTRLHQEGGFLFKQLRESRR